VIRPRPAEWFEILCAREDAVALLEALARGACVELEAGDAEGRDALAAAMRQAMSRFDALAQRFGAWWPAPGEEAAEAVALNELLARDLARLEAWAAEAGPVIEAIQAGRAERSDLALWQRVLGELRESPIDFAQLAQPGAGVQAALLAFPGGADPVAPPGVLARRIQGEAEFYLLAVGPPAGMAALGEQAALLQGRRIELPPWMKSSVAENLAWLGKRLAEVDESIAANGRALAGIGAKHSLAKALGGLRRAQWMLAVSGAIEAGENFCRVTGWTSDRGRLAAAIGASGARALAHFPQPPRGREAPLLLQNPWWARPFEIFSRALGMPPRHGADPTKLLAFIVPLLFGYMFGDVGQGAVLIAAGFAFRDRVPVLRMLVPCGVSAILFGLAFGSVFGMEGRLPALWVQPLDQPLPVLIVPLIGGVVLLLLGLTINALEAYWRGRFRHWLAADAGLVVVYGGLLGGFLDALGYWIAALGALLPVAGELVMTRRLRPALAAAGDLLEKTVRLLINTLSFVRVGAFALGHAGLSAAIVALAEGATSVPGYLVVMIAGNVLAIAIEALVVSVQTTRLVLFEFFTRFFIGRGREFRPLAPPPVPIQGELRESTP